MTEPEQPRADQFHDLPTEVIAMLPEPRRTLHRKAVNLILQNAADGTPFVLLLRSYAELAQAENAPREMACALTVLGATFDDLGDFPTAEATLRKAAAIIPDNQYHLEAWLIRIRLATVLKHSGRTDTAWATLGEAIRIVGSMMFVQDFKGKLHLAPHRRGLAADESRRLKFHRCISGRFCPRTKSLSPTSAADGRSTKQRGLKFIGYRDEPILLGEPSAWTGATLYTSALGPGSVSPLSRCVALSWFLTQLTLSTEHRAAASQDYIPLQLTQDGSAFSVASESCIPEPGSKPSALQRVQQILAILNQPITVQQLRKLSISVKMKPKGFLTRSTRPRTRVSAIALCLGSLPTPSPGSAPS